MNKLILGICIVIAMVMFCFFSPLFLIVFGLCIAIFGVITLLHPEWIKLQIKDPFYKRVISSFVMLLGIGLLSFGGYSTYQLYLAPDSKDNIFVSSNQDPQSFGQSTNRPGSYNNQNTNPTSKKKVVTKSTQSTLNTSSKPINQPLTSKSTTTKPATSSSTVTTTNTNSTVATSSTTSSTFPGKGNGVGSTKTTPATTHAHKK